MVGGRPPTRPDGALGELVRGAQSLGIQLSPEARSRFAVYLDTLLVWRTRMSLTSTPTARDIVRTHILDSLRVVQFIKAGSRVADLGSGAGFPGVPVAIVRPDVRVFLIESRRKKANFLRAVARAAGLSNVEVVEQRAEQLDPTHLGGTVDVAVSRAVWDISVFLEVVATLLRVGGSAVAMKGPKVLAQPPPRDPRFDPPDIVTYRVDGSARGLLVYRRTG
jgi:16S rRNA (guanine527-N7)-methyltransferase